MRVLHLSSGNLYGGVETFLVTLARHGGAGAAMEASYALSAEGRLSEELRAAGAPVHPLGAVRARNPLSVRGARRTLRELLRRERFDAAVCHSAWAQALFGPTVRDAGVPLVFYLHGDVQGRHWTERLARRVRPDLVVGNSRYTLGTLPNLYPGARAELVAYPVEAPDAAGLRRERDATRAELGAAPGDVVIVQSCRLEPWKGHRLHLEALGRLRDVPGWTCWQVGGVQRDSEAAYLRELQAQAERLGIAERVRWVGQRRDVPRILAAADVHCQPNLGPEPFGIAYVEALYAGLPVVSTAMGGAAEIVDPGCGILTPPGDADALAGALRRLVADPALRASLGAAGPARAAELCAPGRQVERLARALAGAGRPTGSPVAAERPSPHPAER
jgi:glycosyltransferase involved in cell wall biosynthesis